MQDSTAKPNRKPEPQACKRSPLREVFRQMAGRISQFMGSAFAFACAILLIVLWLVSGPFFGYSDTWQLIINTSTTVITFLMVFLIQNTQNRDTRTLHLKIDELLRSIESARTRLVNLDELPEEELERLQQQFRGIAEDCDDDDLPESRPPSVKSLTDDKRS